MTPARRQVRRLLVTAGLFFPLGTGLILTGASLGALLVPTCSDGNPELARRCAQPLWWLGAGAFFVGLSVLTVIVALVLHARARKT